MDNRSDNDHLDAAIIQLQPTPVVLGVELRAETAHLLNCPR